MGQQPPLPAYPSGGLAGRAPTPGGGDTCDGGGLEQSALGATTLAAAWPGSEA